MPAVKRKLKNAKLIQKCQIIRQIEKGMTNKEASEKFGIPIRKAFLLQSILSWKFFSIDTKGFL